MRASRLFCRFYEKDGALLMGIFDGVLILSDLDGTLLNSSAEISERNIEAVKDFMANGGRFSFATGRNYTSMSYFYDCIPVNAPAVTSNGAVIYDFDAGCARRVYALGELGEKIARELLSRFDDIGIEVMLEDTIYVLKHDPINEMHIRYTKASAHYGGFEDIPKPWVHLLVTRDPATIGEVYDFVASNYSGSVFCQYSAPYFLEILIEGATKGAGARCIADMLDISYDDLYTVGDGLNDVQLLTCTQNSFAPENCHGEVRKIASHILPDNDHDTIAELIEHIRRTREV